MRPHTCAFLGEPVPHLSAQQLDETQKARAGKGWARALQLIQVFDDKPRLRRLAARHRVIGCQEVLVTWKRRIQFTVLGLLLLTADTRGAGRATEDAILTLDDQRIQAMIAGDLATLDHLLADELTYVHSTGQLESKAEFLARLKSGALKYKAMRREDVHVRVIGCAAVVTGRAVVDVRSKGADFSLLIRFTDVYVERGDGWQMVTWQSTRIQ